VIPGIGSGVVKRTVKEMISDKIEALIGSGVIQLGDELPGERELAGLMSVSRESVRGAIRTLAVKGIVEVSHGARTRVVSTRVDERKFGLSSPNRINAYDLDSVHKARLLVERAVVADAARTIDAATLARLDASLEAQRETMDDPIRVLICDREFHLAIYRSAENPLLGDFVIDLYTYMLDHRRRAVSLPGAIRRSYGDHVAIVAALRAHDPDAVVAAFGRHIDRIYETTVSVLEERKEKARPRRRAANVPLKETRRSGRR
jgi:DNA-binding FadR family transcriptional regulator